MSVQTIVTSQTDAATSDAFFVPKTRQVSIHCTPDLVSAEVATVEISLDNTTFVTYQDGAPVRLTATINALRLYGPAWYKVAKSATAGATAILKQD